LDLGADQRKVKKAELGIISILAQQKSRIGDEQDGEDERSKP
jgi:hypothetical protein